MSRLNLRSTTLHLTLALLIGLGLGLVYSWFLSPVTYVDANPAILRADFKDQYRIVIAASYTSTHDLPRARARLELLGDADPTGALSAQAQRMLAAGELFEKVRPLAQLATDLTQSVASVPPTNTPLPSFNTPDIVSTPSATEPAAEEDTDETTATALPTISFEQTPLIPVTAEINTPRPTFTSAPAFGPPFTLVGQDTICEPGLQAGLLQFIFMDSRRKQVAGVEVVATWNQGEDRFFSGFKPELGNGYADFVMQAETLYSIRVVTGGSFVPNITSPTCTDPNGTNYPGSVLLTFQQP
ncbi:MAG: hypothetical protein QY332_18380 [Anaerolineales bacterium]|nr:MAG: hypothetical protein QY332_18380 [Anaerolineales bacterium]